MAIQTGEVTERAADILFGQENKNIPLKEENESTDSSEIEGSEAEESGQDAVETEEVEMADSDDEEVDGEDNRTAEEIKSLSDLAKAIEVEDQFLYDIKVPMPAGMPDGMKEMSLGQLKDSAHAWNVETARAKAAQEQYIQAKTQFSEKYNEVLDLPIGIAKAEAQVDQIRENFQSIDWEKLKEQDKEQYNTLRLDYQEAFSKAQAQAKGMMQEYTRAQQVMKQEQFTAAADELHRLIPEWKTEETFNKDRLEIIDQLGEYGFAAQEIETIMDPRVLKLVYDLTKIKGRAKKGQAQIKEVRNKPRALSPGKVRSVTDQKKDELKFIIKKAKTGNIADKQNAARALLGYK